MPRSNTNSAPSTLDQKVARLLEQRAQNQQRSSSFLQNASSRNSVASDISASQRQFFESATSQSTVRRAPSPSVQKPVTTSTSSFSKSTTEDQQPRPQSARPPAAAASNRFSQQGLEDPEDGYSVNSTRSYSSQYQTYLQKTKQQENDEPSWSFDDPNEYKQPQPQQQPFSTSHFTRGAMAAAPPRGQGSTASSSQVPALDLGQVDATAGNDIHQIMSAGRESGYEYQPSLNDSIEEDDYRSVGNGNGGRSTNRRPGGATAGGGGGARTPGRPVSARPSSASRNRQDDGEGSPADRSYQQQQQQQSAAQHAGRSRARPSSAPRERTPSVPLPGGRPPQPSRISKEVVAQKLEEERKKECTFKPKTNNYVGLSVDAMSREERIERLSKPRSTSVSKWEKEKLEEETKKMQECTFKPQLVSKSDKILEVSQMRDMTVPVEERLHHEADRRLEKRERARRELEQQRMSDCSFHPRTNHSSSRESSPTNAGYQGPEGSNLSMNSSFLLGGAGGTGTGNYRPLHERVGEIQRRKSEMLNRMRVEQEITNPDLTFTPRVNERSAKIAQERSMIYGSQQSFLDRLNGELNTSVAKLNRRLSVGSAAAADDRCTFKPELNPVSEKIVQNSKLFDKQAGIDFVKRQQMLEQRTKKKIEMEQKFLQDKSDCTFKPKVDPTSKILVETNRARRGETEEEKIERLANRDKARIENTKVAIEQHYLSQFTFKPEINRVSKVIGRPTPIDELVANERTKHKRHQIAQEVETKMRQQCTFQPNRDREDRSPTTPRTPSKFSDPEYVSRMIADHKERKERMMQQAQREAEYESLKDCTFQPDVRPATPKQPSGPILVRGLGSFLERKEFAKKLEDDKKERLENAFKVKQSALASPGMPYTVPQPFSLHTEYHAETRRQKAEEKVKRERSQECTFRPKTNEALNRQLINRILTDDDDDI